MAEYHFHTTIKVRYGDLDPQGHVNNSVYLTYLEEARVGYLQHLGLFRAGQSFLELGVIMADAHINFKAPILLGQTIRLGMRISRLGNKSMTSEIIFEDADSGAEVATGSSVLVAYDYHAKKSIPIPEEWREKISAFEHLGS